MEQTMKFLGLILLTTLAVAVFVFLTHILLESPLTVHGWDYQRGVSSNRLDTWGNMSTYCLGSSQSPVDLDALKLPMTIRGGVPNYLFAINIMLGIYKKVPYYKQTQNN